MGLFDSVDNDGLVKLQSNVLEIIQEVKQHKLILADLHRAVKSMGVLEKQYEENLAKINLSLAKITGQIDMLKGKNSVDIVNVSGNVSDSEVSNERK